MVLEKPREEGLLGSIERPWLLVVLWSVQMVFELGDDCKVTNKAQDAVCDLDFKTKACAVRACIGD